MMESVQHFRLTLTEFSEIRLRSSSPSHPTLCLIYRTIPFQLLDKNSDNPCGPGPCSATVLENLICTITSQQLQILFSVTKSSDALTVSKTA
jgi:hypothetical protein